MCFVNRAIPRANRGLEESRIRNRWVERSEPMKDGYFQVNVLSYIPYCKDNVRYVRDGISSWGYSSTNVIHTSKREGWTRRRAKHMLWLFPCGMYWLPISVTDHMTLPSCNVTGELMPLGVRGAGICGSFPSKGTQAEKERSGIQQMQAIVYQLTCQESNLSHLLGQLHEGAIAAKN